jgi:DNA mismatch repair protein MLH3
MLPPSILERCRLEPRLLVDLLRKEIWKLYGMSSSHSGGWSSVAAGSQYDWVAKFHDCPEGVLDLIHSRACRSRSSVTKPVKRLDANKF